MNTTDEMQSNGTNMVLAAVGDTVNFKYKGGRKVSGLVKWINTKGVGLILETDYIGKNVEWFKGEYKDFNIKECKGFRIFKANCS